MGAVVNIKEKEGHFRQVNVYKTLRHWLCKNSPTSKHIIQISPSTSSSIFLPFQKCRPDSENAAKSGTLSGSDKCSDGGATRLECPLIAYLPTYPPDMWLSVSEPAAGASSSGPLTWTTRFSRSFWFKPKRSTGSPIKALWQFLAKSRYLKKSSGSSPDRSLPTRVGSWNWTIFKVIVISESEPGSIYGRNPGLCFMGWPRNPFGNAGVFVNQSELAATLQKSEETRTTSTEAESKIQIWLGWVTRDGL